MATPAMNAETAHAPPAMKRVNESWSEKENIGYIKDRRKAPIPSKEAQGELDRDDRAITTGICGIFAFPSFHHGFRG